MMPILHEPPEASFGLMMPVRHGWRGWEEGAEGRAASLGRGGARAVGPDQPRLRLAHQRFFYLRRRGATRRGGGGLGKSAAMQLRSAAR